MTDRNWSSIDDDDECDGDDDVQAINFGIQEIRIFAAHLADTR